jgi:hypothetical protein
MKTYTVLLPENPSPALVAVVDATIRGFQLAVNASTAYKWRSLNLGYAPGPRWIDTNCDVAVDALAMEMNSIGVRITVQKVEVAAAKYAVENWDQFRSQAEQGIGFLTILITNPNATSPQ